MGACKTLEMQATRRSVPQYFRVVERARLGEAHTFVSQIKQSQERFLARNGRYASAFADIANLDITFGGTCAAAADKCGMANFQMTTWAGAACPSGGPGWQISLTRCTTGTCPAVATRYQVGGAGYPVAYDSCTGLITYGTCANCTADF